MSRIGTKVIAGLVVTVVVVIAICSGVVLMDRPVSGSHRDPVKLQIDLFATALDAYKDDVGRYPSTAAGLQALRTPPAELADQSKWKGPYLTRDIPLDRWGKPYQYACPGRHNASTFDVWTVTPESEEMGNWMEAIK